MKFKRFQKSSDHRDILAGRAAFTLIEMLVVIVIIGILSTVIISQYTSATRSSKLQTLMDDVVVELKDARDRTVSGYRAPLYADKNCFGVGFLADNGGGMKRDEVSAVVGLFKPETDTCQFNSQQGYFDTLYFPKGFQINKVYTKGDSCADGSAGYCDSEMIIYFKPPDGRFAAIRRGPGHVDNQDDFVTIEIGLPGKTLDSPFVKAISLDYPSGKLEIINN